MTAPILSDFTLQYGVSGLLLNNTPTDFSTPIIDIEKITGLDSAPFRSSTKALDGRDGGIAEAEFLNVRTIVISGTIYGQSGYPIGPYLDQLKANFAPSKTDTPLYIKEPGNSQRQIFCKSLGFKYDWDVAYRTNCTAYQITLIAANPVVYSSDQRITYGTNTSTTVFGFGFNLAFNFGFGGVVVPANSVVTNAGNKEVGGTITITGSGTNVRILNLNTGKTLSTSVSVGSGDSLVFDLDYRRLTLNGVSRRGSVTAENWFKFQPGQTTLQFQTDSGTISATVLNYDGWQ